MFAKARRSSLIQSTYSSIKMFSWATIKPYSIKYAILDRFWAFLWKYKSLAFQEYLKTSCSFQILMKYI